MPSRTRLGDGDIALTHDASGSAVTQPFILAEEDGFKVWRQGVAPMLSPQQRTSSANLFDLTPPEIEVPLGFQSFIGGAGFEEIGSGETNALKVYNYSQGVDLSWGDRAYLSPLLQTGGTVSATNPKKYVWSEELGLFAINDRFVYEWTGAAWTERFDVGAGGLINDLREHINATDTYLLLGIRGDPYYFSIDGAEWFQVIAPGSTPTFRAQANTGSTGTSITITKPSGTAENDILIANIVRLNADVLTAPDGWNILLSQNWFFEPTYTIAYFWKRATGSEGANYTFSGSNSTTQSGWVAAYTGVRRTGAPYDAFLATENSGDNTSHIALGITTVSANTLILYMGVTEDGSITYTPPSGYTERLEETTGPGSYLADDNFDTPGDTGSITATLSAGDIGFGALIALVPQSTNPFDIVSWGVRGSSSGEVVGWGMTSTGDIRNFTDPIDVVSWSAADATQVGEDAHTIAGMQLIDNTFYIFRDTEIVSYDGTTVSTVFSSPTFKLKSGAARPFLWVDGYIYFTYNSTLYQFQALDNVITAVWPPEAGNSELNGTIMAIAGDDHNLCFSVKNVAGNTYIMKGDPRRPITVGAKIVYPFHTWAYRGANDCNALLIVPGDSDAMHTSNPHLVLTDGASADYFIIPRDGLRPEDDSNVRYETTADQIVNGSFVDWGARAMNKFLNRGVIVGDDWDGDDTIALQYQLPGGSATTIVTGNDTTGDKAEAALTAEVEFQTLRYVSLFNNGASTTTPICQGFALHATLNPPRKRTWAFRVEVAPGQLTPSGAASRHDPQNTVEFLFAALEERCTLTDRYGTDYTVRILDVQELGMQELAHGDRELFDVFAVQI